MRTDLTVAATILSLLLMAVPLSAHHAFAAEFDARRPVKLRGTVKKVELINPHSWIHIDVKSADGQVTTWMIEGGSPNTLLRRGVNRNTLPVGTEIVVDGYQAKDGSKKANGRDVTFPDGRKLFLSNAAPNEAPDK